MLTNDAVSFEQSDPGVLYNADYTDLENKIPFAVALNDTWVT